METNELWRSGSWQAGPCWLAAHWCVKTEEMASPRGPCHYFYVPTLGNLVLRYSVKYHSGCVCEGVFRRGLELVLSCVDSPHPFS